MTPKTIADEIDASIRGLASRDTESLREVRREFSKRLAKASPEFMLELGHALVKRSEIDRFMAYELITCHREALGSLRAKDLEQLGQGIDNWGAVDTFACYLAGPAWRERQVPDKLIHSWARSKDLWWRRAALVSTVPLNSKARGGSGDTCRTLEVCQMLVRDQEDMIVKALSWALRALSVRDPDSVREFLAENEEILAARIKREVQNKLSTGLKNPRKKATPKRIASKA